MNKIAERAGGLGLFATANALADAKIDPDAAPRDGRLVEPVGGDVKRILGQMARRGPEHGLLAALWAKLADRPLERSLVAVDVLARSIVSERDPLLAELREAASMLGAARPPAGEVGIDLVAHTARELIERHAPRANLESANTVDLVARAYEQPLGVLDELLRRDDPLLARPNTRDSIHAFAKLLALARLPTLSSIYYDWLIRGLGWRAPAIDLCETLFDAGVANKIPGTTIQPGDVPESEQRDLAEYCLVRSHLGVGDSETANALLLQAMEKRPRWIRPPSVRLDVVRAHLGTLYGHGSVTLIRVESACARDPLWRYGAQVRAIVAAKQASTRALEMFHAQLAAFGNDFDTAHAVIAFVPEPVKRDIARILCREAYYVPHEPAPWRLLGLLFGEEVRISADIEARLRAQSS